MALEVTLPFIELESPPSPPNTPWFHVRQAQILIDTQALTALMTADKLNQECKWVCQCSFPLQNKKSFF
jgi:hypothetical protein